MEIRNQKGFVSVIALAMFAIMMLYAISLQMITMDTMEGIKSRNNYRKARIIADSMMQYLQWKAKNYEVGWNTGTVVCGFGRFAEKTTKVAGGDISEFCKEPGLLAMVTPKPGDAQKDIIVTMSIKGHAEDAEKIKTSKCGDSNNNCYVVPSPGTGDAGHETYCKIYKPAFVSDNGAQTTVPAELANGSNQLDQVNYGCNWNKLQFGSSLMDRVAIPLYYESAKVGEESNVVNPFYSGTADQLKAKNILVRLRTPCVPCKKKMANGQPRVCDDTVKDETVCNDNERYVLDDGGELKSDKNDIVVQWLLNGECDDDGDGKFETCGVIPIGDKGQLKFIPYLSAFYESIINLATSDNIKNFMLITNNTKVYDTNSYPKTASLMATIDEENYPKKLDKIFKPVLTLFLSKPLLTTEKWGNVPYLEYQILSDKPVSSNESVLEVDVGVDTNGFTKTMAKEVPKQLIDFAIQN